LHFASAASDSYATILIQHGADIWVKEHHNRTPLHFAAQAGQSNVVGLLLQSYEKESKSVDAICLKKRSALHEACRTGCQETVQLLIDAGANPQLQDRDGRTPLHAAAEFQYLTTGCVKQSKYDSVVSGSKKSTPTVELNSWDAVSQKQVSEGEKYINHGELYRDIR
jgi:ankyrin repeat protein